MTSRLHPAKAWLLFASAMLCGIAWTGFVQILITFDPDEAPTALRQCWIWGTVLLLACAGYVQVYRVFRRSTLR